MPDQARAKLFKALGRASAASAAAFDPQADNAVAGGKAALLEAAIGHFGEAIRLNKKVGAIPDKPAAEAAIAKLAPPTPAPARARATGGGRRSESKKDAG